MRRPHLLFVTIMLAGLGVLTACSAAEPPPAVAIEDACAPENDGQQAAVTGYFQVDFMIFCTDSCTLDFAATPDGESPLAPDVTIGPGRSQMRDLPDDFTAADFQVRAQDGTVLGLNDRVQISGRMSIAPDVCLMYVDRIDAAP
ncbi:MAG: hypothetical protein IT326_01590 [Anaerolineae bacterium]|nr:hypothetical protein [Anaerolineae bacterium]